jgi:hypothetical protein
MSAGAQFRSKIPTDAQIARAVDAGTWQAADYVRDIEAQIAPKDTGDLASTPRVEPARGSGDGTYRVLAGGIPGKKTGRLVTYAEFVEEDQPFASVALREVNLKAAIAAALRKEIG